MNEIYNQPADHIANPALPVPDVASTVPDMSTNPDILPPAQTGPAQDMQHMQLLDALPQPEQPSGEVESTITPIVGENSENDELVSSGQNEPIESDVVAPLDNLASQPADVHANLAAAGGNEAADYIDPDTGGLNNAAYDKIDEAHGPNVAQGVDYQVQRIYDGSATAPDHEIPGIGRNPDALGEYFAGWEGNLTHTDMKTGALVAYDDFTGCIIVEKSYMIHGYQLSKDVFDNAVFRDSSDNDRQRYVLL